MPRIMHRALVLAVGASVVFLAMAAGACSRSSPSSESSGSEAAAGAEEAAGAQAVEVAPATVAPATAAAAAVVVDGAGRTRVAPTAEERARALQGVREHCMEVTWNATIEVSPIKGSVAEYELRDGDRRWLAFFDHASGSCRVYPVGRAVARWNGAYWDEEPDTKAFVLTRPGASDDELEEQRDMMVALRRQTGEVLDVWETPCNGAYGAGLQAFDVFPGRRSLMLSCYSESGMARHEHLYLYHRVEDEMALVWHGDGSWVDADRSCAEDCPETCYAYKRHRFQVVREDGAPPALETVSPTFVGTDHEEHMDHEHGAPKKPMNKQRWRYDAGKGAFVAVAEASFELLPVETTCDVGTVMP